MSGEKMRVSDQAAPRDHRIVHRLSQMQGNRVINVRLG